MSPRAKGLLSSEKKHLAKSDFETIILYELLHLLSAKDTENICNLYTDIVDYSNPPFCST